MEGVTEAIAREAFRLAASKLSVDTLSSNGRSAEKAEELSPRASASCRKNSSSCAASSSTCAWRRPPVRHQARPGRKVRRNIARVKTVQGELAAPRPKGGAK